jgi:hypothetical protein
MNAPSKVPFKANLGSYLEPKFKKRGGYVLHRGTVNGEPYVVIATMETANRKTGNMVQIWFLLEDVHPVDAVRSGLDASTICRECPFASGGGCYVNVGQAPAAVWKAYHRGSYPEIIPAHYALAFSNRKIRFGAYGNPTLLPLAMVKAIASVSAGWTGYFHDWRTNPLAHGYSAYFMASTETESSLRLASALGFRTFHVSPVKPEESMECLAETRGMECSQCKLCAGLSKQRQPSIWINPHGTGKKKASRAALGSEVLS